MYAVNVADLTKYHRNYVLMLMLGRVVDPGTTVVVNARRFDGIGVRLDCAEEQGQAICELVRRHYRKSMLRCYYSSDGANWKRI